MGEIFFVIFVLIFCIATSRLSLNFFFLTFCMSLKFLSLCYFLDVGLNFSPCMLNSSNCLHQIMKFFKFTFHLLAATTFIYAIYQVHVRTVKMTDAKVIKTGPFPYQFRFLTFWNLVADGVYWSVCSLKNFNIKILSERQISVLFLTLILPLSVVVCSQFWMIYMIEPRMLTAPRVRPFYPVFFQHWRRF